MIRLWGSPRLATAVTRYYPVKYLFKAPSVIQAATINEKLENGYFGRMSQHTTKHLDRSTLTVSEKSCEVNSEQ